MEEKEKGGGVECGREEREGREGESEIGQGGAAERKGKESKSGQRAERRRTGREREARGGRSEGMEKCGDIAAERMV